MTQRVIGLTDLRAVACLTVLIAHAAAHPLPEAPVWTWAFGRFGVTLFFVISGFVMVLTTGQGRFDPVQFFKKRLLRIVPLYWIATLVTAAIAATGLPVFKNTVLDLPHLIGSLLFWPMWRPANPDAVEPFLKLGWTLNYEMFFYAIFALMFFASARARLAGVAILFIGLTVLGRLTTFEAAPLVFWTGYDLLGFPAGMAVALLMGADRNRDVPRGTPMGAYALSGLAVLGMVGSMFALADRSPVMWFQIVLVLGASLMVAAAARGASSAGLPSLAHKAFQRIGDASFSIYLFHMFGVGAAVVAGRLVWGETEALGILAGISLLAFLCGLCAGFVAWAVFERPALKITRRLSRPAHSSVG